MKRRDFGSLMLGGMAAALGGRRPRSSLPRGRSTEACAFADAGLSIFSLNMSFNVTYSDAEIERGMAMAQSLGTRIHHARITNLHVKARQRNQGCEMPFGQGDTSLGEVLELVQRERLDMPVLHRARWSGRTRRRAASSL